MVPQELNTLPVRKLNRKHPAYAVTGYHSGRIHKIPVYVSPGIVPDRFHIPVIAPEHKKKKIGETALVQE